MLLLNLTLVMVELTLKLLIFHGILFNIYCLNCIFVKGKLFYNRLYAQLLFGWTQETTARIPFNSNLRNKDKLIFQVKSKSGVSYENKYMPCYITN